MEGNFSGGVAPFRDVNLQGSNRVHHQPQYPHSTTNTSDQPISLSSYNKGHKGKNSTSDEDEPIHTEDGFDSHDLNEVDRGKKALPWQRVKWTDTMVKLLITAISYIGDDTFSDFDGGMRRKFAALQRKGKWKLVSKAMAERGFPVSPQQCEDKFNDVNKRYKKLNDMLGRGTSCQVVENPALLDAIDYLSEKEKDDVRKLLSSKQLFYEEMCSYRNGNRLHLPHDLALRRSLQLALRSEEDDFDGETDDRDEFRESCPKRFRREDACFGNSRNLEVSRVDVNRMSFERQKQWMEPRALQLEEQRLQIQLEMFELEKQQFKWKRFSAKKDQELDKLRMENERMKLENERMALELKRKEVGVDFG